MNRIVNKKKFSENVFLMEIESPYIARNCKAGNFVIVKAGKKGERVPLTIAKSDSEKGTITLVIQRVGLSSIKLTDLEIGDKVTDIAGPLGHATEIKKYGTVLAAGGGVGAAPLLPIIKAMKETGNRVLTVIAGRSKEFIILEAEIRKYSDELLIMSDDGSYGLKGLVTEGMETLIKREHIDFAVNIGPTIMMKFASLLTKKYEIPTIASLNTMMVDGTGMCGACRVTVGGETKFVCVDGPEFNAHKVDFDEMIMRLKAFKTQEQIAVKNHTCRAEKRLNETIVKSES